MSIFPKKLIKGKDDFTTFHMRICNNSDEDIIGQIKYKVILPDGNSIEMDIDRTEKVEANSELNEYDNFYIKAEYPIGRYFVEGRFIWDGMDILSDTNKDDFFDVITNFFSLFFRNFFIPRHTSNIINLSVNYLFINIVH